MSTSGSAGSAAAGQLLQLGLWHPGPKNWRCNPAAAGRENSRGSLVCPSFPPSPSHALTAAGSKHSAPWLELLQKGKTKTVSQLHVWRKPESLQRTKIHAPFLSAVLSSVCRNPESALFICRSWCPIPARDMAGECGSGCCCSLQSLQVMDSCRENILCYSSKPNRLLITNQQSAHKQTNKQTEEVKTNTTDTTLKQKKP